MIGGSGTLSIDFPEDLEVPGLEVLETEMVFDTPYGESPPFKLFRTAGKDESRAGSTGGQGKTVLTCRMHGWRRGTSRADASRQVFWVFREAGVSRILAEGGVGSINRLLDLKDFVIADDYIDLSMRRDVDLGGPYLLVMRRALCPEVRKALAGAAAGVRRTFDRGVYANTDGRHFESPAEVAAMRQMGADIVGQSICPEVYLAREIGACYAGLYMVVNYAEGVIRDWEHRDLTEIFYGESLTVGRILIEALRALPPERGCQCQSLRKNTLLKEKSQNLEGPEGPEGGR